LPSYTRIRDQAFVPVEP